MPSSARLEDVARAAGVSPKTVSRVVNGEANVSPQTREAVEQAIARLGYRPNLAARALVMSRSFLIGAISPRLEHFYFYELHNRLIRACRERGLHLVVEELDFASDHAVADLERMLRQMRLEGLVLSPPVSDNRRVLELLDRLNQRYVRLAPATPWPAGDCVMADEIAGMERLADHLWSLGHREFLALLGPQGMASTIRPHVLREALLRRGAEPGRIAFQPIDLTLPVVEAGREAAALMLQRAVRPTAVFAFNDEVAAGMVGYATEHGIRVPDELSIAGFDDSDVANAIWPPLTTVKQPIDAMARAAIRLLCEPADSGQARSVSCPVEFVARRSTAAPPSTGSR